MLPSVVAELLDLIKDLGRESILDYPGEQEGQEIQRRCGSESRDCWALKMEDGAMSQKYGWPLEAENGKETKSPTQASGRKQLC